MPEARSAQPRLAALTPWLVYPALALLVTWPLVTRMGSHLPLGELPEATVPWLNLWTLEWNADRLAHGFAGYWNAPIFFPAQDTLAMSEPLGLEGLIFAPLAWLFGPVAGYDCVLLIALIANAFAIRRLLSVLGVSALCATCSGALALGLPFVLKEAGVLQLTWLAPACLVFAELCVLFRGPTPGARGALLRLPIWIAATLWSCVYYALFLALFLLLALPFLVHAWGREWLAREWRMPLAAASLLLAAACAPLLYTQHTAIARERRSADELYHGSASARAYARAPAQALVTKLTPALRADPGARTLYPGAVLFALACFGFASARRARTPGVDRVFLAYGALSLLLAVLLSFGTRLPLGALHPYASIIQAYVPGYAQLRSPYRFAAFVQLFLVVFAGLGLSALSTRYPRQVWLLPALVALALCETVPFGLSTRRFPSEALHAPWVTWLAQHPAGAVAMVPPALSGRARDYEPVTLAMLQGLEHHHPLVEGYSGFFPYASDRLATRALYFPSPGAVHALRHAGVRYVVVDNAWLAHATPEKVQASWWHRTRTVFSSNERNIYELTAP